MSYMKFICEHTDAWNGDSVVTRTTVETNNVVLQDVLQDFEDFLRGAGFQIQGKLEIVDEQSLQEEEESRARWAGVVDSLNNPPKFRTTEQVCGVCRLTEDELAGHHCWDKNCPFGGNRNNAD